ncbi:conserved hypothetical protein [Talaromyces stipitatus ATCC 10500]|uniref:Uncharacterized protein n=1 Tax=Talaromyces stipitatus (strain ATCC 10500 / CBS 375.48 / QM 6759 / NRRL 1006) TaxID=441959 RepID=B8MIT4_TALSN|nr:uncharacterized protein TSTA_050350 [Talaromyces stipitatus ATCC 10500]EED15596.1 conserved hypothetical protein [Talaromyces stipitatus ATCC 10500]
MSAADNEQIADSEDDDIFGPLDNLPVVSSSESWHGSSDPSSESDEAEGIAEDTSEENEVEPEREEAPRSEDEGQEARLVESKRSRISAELRLQHDRRSYLSGPSIRSYKGLLKDMHVDPDSKTIQWTKKENDAFFTALARKGKLGVHEIAQQIKTKSRLEISDYIEFLEERLQGHRLSEKSLLEVEVPAAAEINEGLERVLDRFAEFVTLEEQKKELLKAKKEGISDFWILNSTKADEVEELFTSAGEDALPDAISLGAALLDVKNWIRLSEKIFMNPGKSRSEDNWKNVALKGETPSLTADALGEFYDLTVDLVIRLMEEAHNTAQDRLAKERRKRRHFVRRGDVHRALTIMGMKHSPFDYYIHLPRRLNLDVAHIMNKKGKQTVNTYVPYDKVERILSKRLGRGAGASSGSSAASSQEDSENDKYDKEDYDENEEDDIDELGLSEDDSETHIQDDQNTDGIDEHSSDDEDRGPNANSPEKQQPDESEYEEIDDAEHQQLENEQRLEEYNDYLDRQASQMEEARLRELLKCPAMDSLEPVDEKGQGEPPEITEEMRRDIMQNNAAVDWRSDLVYQAEWETYGSKHRDVERDIVANQHKRRRIG